MDFKIGDKVKMINERNASAQTLSVWHLVGEVIAVGDDPTSIKRISVKFPNGVIIAGMDNGQFKLA